MIKTVKEVFGNSVAHFCRIFPLLVFMTAISTTVARGQDRLEILAIHFPPFAFEVPKDGLKGFDVEVVEEVFKRMGTPAKVVFRPWSRAKRLVFIGGKFALLSCSQRKDQDAFLLYSAPISRGTLGYFYHRDYKGGLPVTTEGLRGHTVAVVRDYSQHRELQELGINYYPVNTDAVAVTIVAKKRVEFGYVPMEAATHAAREADIIDQVRYKIFNKKDFHFCISRKWPDAEKIMQQFNEELKKLKDDGTYAAIHGKYGSQHMGN